MKFLEKDSRQRIDYGDECCLLQRFRLPEESNLDSRVLFLLVKTVYDMKLHEKRRERTFRARSSNF